MPVFGGATVIAILSGAWRCSAGSVHLSLEQLGRGAALLLQTGAGALGWRRLRESEARATAPGRLLHQAYRLQSLQAAAQEDQLKRVVHLFRSAGIEPILIKGWAAARLYPETGLRPYGDLDLCVRPNQLLDAMAVLTRAARQCGVVELHEGIPDVTDRSWDQLYHRSRLSRLDEVDVRILGPEDQLRQLCLHFWRHNACRPLWLCDVGAAFKRSPMISIGSTSSRAILAWWIGR